ncbi:MAG: transcriptional regulator GcvA [Alphaproteobacteria bacterium]
MAVRLPPLNTLRAFEAAARHLSFTKAADELFVTQAAVSHQIKTLEEALGVILFRRLNRAIMLTPEGQTFLPFVRDGLQSIAGGVERLRKVEATGPLNVTTLPSFASGWLVPRLSRFRKAHPEIDVRLTAIEKMVDFNVDDVDLAIRFGTGNYPGITSIKVMRESVFPVCSPALVTDGPYPLKTLDDLRHHTLLHDDLTIGWEVWLKEAGVSGIDPQAGPYFDMSALVIQAAIDGQGVAMARSTLAASALTEGRLVKPFDLTLPLNFAYYFCCPHALFDRPKVKAFREWLQAELKNDFPDFAIDSDESEPG